MSEEVRQFVRLLREGCSETHTLMPLWCENCGGVRGHWYVDETEGQEIYRCAVCKMDKWYQVR